MGWRLIRCSAIFFLVCSSLYACCLHFSCVLFVLHDGHGVLLTAAVANVPTAAQWMCRPSVTELHRYLTALRTLMSALANRKAVPRLHLQHVRV